MTGIDGDYYLNTTSGDLFHKESGSWVLVGNLKGAMGPEGPQGDKGDTGTAGTIWYSGTTDPV